MSPDSEQSGSEQYEDAICPGCGRVLTGSREPGDRDHCQHADREVTLRPANLNPNARSPGPTDSEGFEPRHVTTARAVKKQRETERPPVRFNPEDPDLMWEHGVVP